MSTDPMPLDYDQLDQALSGLDRLSAPAEVHGHLVGCLAAGAVGEAEWLGRLVEEVPTGPLPDSVRPTLAALYQQTARQAAGQELGLTLAVPEDDVPLAERVDALAQWCQAFLAGYGLSPTHAGGRTDAEAEAERDEILRDFAAISQAELEADEADEDASSGERDLLELTEYVRLAAAQLCWARTGEGSAKSLIDGFDSMGSPGETAPSSDALGESSDRLSVDPSRLFRRGPLH